MNGTDYTDPALIEITTIREAMYLGVHNDVSFLITDLMNMYEQQSTYNPNIPLRMLQYTGNIYEKYVTLNKKNKYGKGLVKLPVPKLVVFYNGSDDKPDDMVHNLADAFPEELCEEADIQVRVRMINVNMGHSQGILEACKPLMEYAWIVDKIRELEREHELADAIDIAIEAIPKEFATKVFLDAHRLEVKTMLLTEYDEVRQMDLIKEEGRQEGLEQGRAEGKAEERSLLAKIIGKLLSTGRIEEAQRATRDLAYLEWLVKEEQGSLSV